MTARRRRPKKGQPHRGPEAFHRRFQGIYGERWPALSAALLRAPAPLPLEAELLQPYYLDPASREAAELLAPPPGSTVLDMCAAPGGKTLVLALALQGRGTLIANDRSSRRRERLRRVLQEHLPPELLTAVTITSHDAGRWGLYEQDAYDRILLDAPCSSERHLLRQPALLEDWSSSRTRRLAQQQYAMLAAAFTACRPGGLILYSTCSLSPEENEAVPERLFKKKKGLVREITPENAGQEPPLNADAWEQLQRGRIILPDRCSSRGPLYCCMMEKR